MAEIALGTTYTRMFLMTSSGDHITGMTGLNPTVTVSKAGGVFASPAGTIAEVGNGWYKVAYTATDTSTAGDLALHATAVGADPTDIIDQVTGINVAGTTVIGAGGAGLPAATLTQYRQRAGEAAGFHIFTTTTGAGTSAAIVVGSLVSSELESSFLKDCWMYVPSTGEARRIQKRGLDASSGTVSPDHALASALSIGTNVEFYGKLPPIRMEGRLGLNTIVNKVLSECWTLQKLSIAGVTDQREYQIGAALPWAVEEDQIAEVYYRPQNAAATDDDLLMPRWRWVPGGDNPRLEIGTPIATGDVLKPMLFIPMSWWVQQGGVWGLPVNEGLASETDGGLLDLEGFELIAQWYIYQEQAKWGAPDDQLRFEALGDKARIRANRWKINHLEAAGDIGRDDHWDSLIRVAGSSTSYELQVLSRG